MELQPELPRPVARGRLAAALGVRSASLLSASLVWAHHWNPLAESIVSMWGLATLGALTVSTWSLATTPASRRFAKLGLTLALVSLLGLALAGLLYAAGIDAAGACGGG